MEGLSNGAAQANQSDQSSSSTGNGTLSLQIVQQLWIYGGIPMLILGSIGHVLSLLVLLGSRRMRSLSLTVYLVASALSGLVALHVGLLRQILLRLDGYKRDLRAETSDAGCRIHAALTYFSLQLFSWLQAGVALERVVAVWRPLQYKRWCTWKRSIFFVLSITTMLAALNAIVIASFSLEENLGCYATNEFLFDTVYGSLDLVLYAMIPIAVMVPCNVAIMINIFRSDEHKRSMTVTHSQRRSKQFTVMLLVHNILCIVTTLPISVIFLVPGWTSGSGSSHSNIRIMEWTVFSLLQYFGTTLGFTVYSLLAQRFRQATMDLICRGFNAKVTSLDSTSSSMKSLRPSESGSTGAAMTTRDVANNDSGYHLSANFVKFPKPVLYSN